MKRETERNEGERKVECEGKKEKKMYLKTSIKPDPRPQYQMVYVRPVITDIVVYVPAD